MKEIKVIGIGMGDEASMTVDAKQWIGESDLWIGAARMVRAAAAVCGPRPQAIAYQAKNVLRIIRESDAQRIAVLMSGDIGFYSGARALRAAFETSGEEFKVSWIPGISSLAYFCARIGCSYEDVYPVSLHGRQEAWLRQVAIHEKTFLLLDGKTQKLGQSLLEFGLEDVTVWLGTDLGAPNQNIKKMKPEELAGRPPEADGALAVCLIQNPDPLRLKNPYRRDEEFLRDGKTPMTKEEVRGLILGKLAPEDGDIIYDIGAGSGSVSVACAIAASGGRVYSIESDPAAVELIEKNRRKFACDNIEVVAGHAPEALAGLPAADRIFIGGSGGELGNILNFLGENGGKTRRVVASAITLETCAELNRWAKNTPSVKNMEVCQISVTKSRPIANATMMLGQNPVVIVSFDLL